MHDGLFFGNEGGSGDTIGGHILDRKGYDGLFIGSLASLDTGVVQRVGFVERCAAGNSVCVIGRCNVAPIDVLAIAIDLSDAVDFTTGFETAAAGADRTVVDELAVGNLEFGIAFNIAAVGFFDAAQCNAVDAWHSATGCIFLYMHPQVSVLLVEIEGLDDYIFKQGIEVLGVSLTAVGIEVACSEAQQCKAVELLRHPEYAMAVAGEAASDRTPRNFIVVVGEPLVLHEEWLLAIETGSIGAHLVDTHIAVADVDDVLDRVDKHGEGIFAGSKAHIVEHRHAIEYVVGLVHIEELTVAQRLVWILISEPFTGIGHIDAVLVVGQGEGVCAGIELGVDDVAFFVTIHEFAIGGGKVEAGGAAKCGTCRGDGGIAHDVQVSPLGVGLEVVDRVDGHLANHFALFGIEHIGSQCGHFGIENAQTLDGGRN